MAGISISEVERKELEEELRREINGEVRFDQASRAIYVSDGSNYRQIPIGVVIPRTIDAVNMTMTVCNRRKVPVVSRGGGTALAGQTCNTAVVIDHSKYLHKILEINPEKKTARVEPGVILDQLRNEAEKYHLTFGPDPATHTHNTLGGMIGNNSCGIHSVMAGRTADNVHELEVMTYDGLRMKVGPTSEEELNRMIALGGRIGDIYGGMKKIRDRYAQLIRERYPKIPRRVSGYNLDELLPENGFNVARALVGSEGTLVVVLEALLRLVYSPPKRSLLVLGYPDVYSAGDHIPEIMSFGPVGCEGIDDQLISFMKKKGLHVSDIGFLPQGGGWLIVEFGGEDKQESDQKARQTMEALKKNQNPPSMKLYTDEAEEKLVWEIRESGLGATANVPGEPLAWPGWEDSAVHPDNIGAYLRDFRNLLEEFHLKASLYGHFGQGCLHCRISFDLFSHAGIRNYMRFIEKAADLVEKYGGSFSGEHGDGQSRAFLLEKMFGPELIEAFREFKSLWDPDWKMNPGKIVEPNKPDDDLRLGVNYHPKEPDTYFKFPEDSGSFSRATLRCVGVGKCRRPEKAFMCPSFLVTRDELHTTRGRAHMLFEMFRGDFIRDGWNSKEVFEALEFCLGCKGCKNECPVNVDIATYKEEFLAHYYRNRLRPRAAYGLGLIGYWNRLAGIIPGIANYFTQTPGLNKIPKYLMGVALERSLPKFAPKNFYDWFSLLPDRDEGEEVVLYPDYLNDFIYPEILTAAADILKRWGYRVVLPPSRPPALRPLIHYGMLDLAKSEIKKCLTVLHPFAIKGTPIVFLEPSELSVYRDELINLFPNDRGAHRIKELSMLLSEFMKQKRIEPPRLSGKAVFHGHCHQKALLDVAFARDILTLMGLEYEEPQPGCCGMSGSFGLEVRSYPLSVKIGEEALLPAVRNSDRETFIVADGFSCRTQILEGTGRRALHLAELIQEAFLREGGTKIYDIGLP